MFVEKKRLEKSIVLFPLLNFSTCHEARILNLLIKVSNFIYIILVVSNHMRKEIVCVCVCVCVCFCVHCISVWLFVCICIVFRGPDISY